MHALEFITLLALVLAVLFLLLPLAVACSTAVGASGNAALSLVLIALAVGLPRESRFVAPASLVAAAHASVAVVYLITPSPVADFTSAMVAPIALIVVAASPIEPLRRQD